MKSKATLENIYELLLIHSIKFDSIDKQFVELRKDVNDLKQDVSVLKTQMSDVISVVTDLTQNVLVRESLERFARLNSLKID